MTLSKEDLIKYKHEIESKFGVCKILHAYENTALKNCSDTSNRNPSKGISWIDYWRAMTGCHETRLTCSSCGKMIFVGLVPRLYELIYKQTGDDAAKHRAEGGHVWLHNPSSGKYRGGGYITPLCPVCNAKRGLEIPILKGTIICQELGATINDEK